MDDLTRDEGRDCIRVDYRLGGGYEVYFCGVRQFGTRWCLMAFLGVFAFFNIIKATEFI